METIKIDILNPKALRLLQGLEELDLIKINKDKAVVEFIELVQQIRAKSKEEISLEDIAKEVELVRSKRYEK